VTVVAKPALVLGIAVLAAAYAWRAPAVPPARNVSVTLSESLILSFDMVSWDVGTRHY
jgi:hypothetical protein